MSLKATNLFIKMAAIPTNFVGSPQDLASAMVQRMQILSPNGANFIYVGDSEPTSNVGPWLKNGTQWFVWDASVSRYSPLDITDSETKWFWTGNSAPAGTVPPLWLRTTKDATDQSPNLFGEPIGWHIFNGTGWEAFTGTIFSGPTASRPTSPSPYQEYYDTDISVRLWWERNAWRTIDGVIGDVKAVGYSTLADALSHNPGWALFGDSTQSWRGRIISQATKDAGGSPTAVYTPPANVSARGAYETFGETDGVQINEASTVPYPPQIALWHLVKT